ncbi:MAG TPA: nucleotide exchange factor GrpE [Limnochordia bacterium]|nr:nucleotide exchange factor GrpE [Limnochordia bacterium]
MIVASTEPTKQRQSSGEALLIFLAIFALAATLLIVSVRLLQQPISGVHPAVLLVLATVGLVGSILGLLASARSSSSQQSAAQETSPAPPPAPEGSEQPENVARVRLGKYVQVLEEQVQSLRQERDKLTEETGPLRSAVAAWQQNGVEMLRELERLRASTFSTVEDYAQALSDTTKHFAQLMAPLGIGLIAPAPGDQFHGQLHQAENGEQFSSGEKLIITECLQWGYTINGQVAIPAKVLVAEEQ